MGEQPASGDQRKAWESPAVLAAMISGTFALMGTVTTATIGWMNRPAPPANSAQLLPAGTVDSTSDRTAVAELRTVSIERQNRIDELPPASNEIESGAESPEEPNWRLNFAEFQKAMKGNSESRQAILEACAGGTVIWEGYVDNVSTHTNPSADSAATLTLCESPQFLTQSMFKQPAYCRFNVDDAEDLARLKVGEKVTIAGKFESHSAVGTTVVNCSILKAGNTRISQKDGSVTK